MLSAFIVTKDGAALLPAAVASLRRVADEVLVIVDAESTDASSTVAQAVADRAFRWPVGGSYESVLNEAAAECRGDWLIYGHDDELWPPAFAAQLSALLSRGPQEYVMARRHIVANGAAYIVTEPWYPDWQVRLRSRAAWRAAPWPPQVHSSPVAYQRAYCDINIWHLKFIVKPAAGRAERLARWGELWAGARADHYRKFSLPEQFTWQTAPVPEGAPVDLPAMLAACAEAAHGGMVS